MADEQRKTWPAVDGAPINPYDMPGEPRPAFDPDKYGKASKADRTPPADSPPPTAEESAPVPGPGDPDVELVEVGSEMPAADEAADEAPSRRRK